MDRVIAYDGALPQTTDILNTNKNMLLGLSYLNQAILGSATVIAGLACVPTVPAGLQVNVGPGTIYQMDPTDQAAYGDLGTDPIQVMKQGIVRGTTTLIITPPGTAGQSQVYLVEAILNDVDAGAGVISYYNAANPPSPFAGPAGSGSSQFSTRNCPCVVQLKAGVPATTGTQVTPAPDVGFVGLYAITVANGAVSITGGNIVQLPTAPFFPTLPSVPAGVLNGTWVGCTDNSAGANTFLVTANNIIPAAYVQNMGIRFKATFAITGASTINVNGLGVVGVKKAGGAAVATGDILSGQMVSLVYDGVNFQMENYNGVSGSVTNNFSTVGLPYVVDTGATNALIGTYSPAITSYVAGLGITIKLANAITGATTINCNGLGLKSVVYADLVALMPGWFIAGTILELEYDGTQFQVVNIISTFYRKPTANISIFVNQAIGNDANDGVSNTAGHALATIQGGINKAFTYAPSQFAITVVVEAGVYNEAPATPGYAGPNIILQGVGSVTVNGGAAANTFVVTGPNTMTVTGFTATNAGPAGQSSIFASYSGATINVNGNTSGASTGSVFAAYSGSTCVIGNHTFSGSCGSLYSAGTSGTVTWGAGSVQTISGPLSVSTATAVANNASIVANGSPTFVNGSFVSGPKYAAVWNGVVSAVGFGVNFFPGSSAGFTANGGQYSP